MSEPTPSMESLLAGSPSNWGRWGVDDELGTLNLLTAADVLAAVTCVRRGQVLTLAVRIGDERGDPAWPGRRAPVKTMTADAALYAGERAGWGGLRAADDVITMALQGTTHTDALGHAWYGDTIYNGYPEASTIGGLRSASILPLAERGLVARGVLLDLARHRGVDALAGGDVVHLPELLACAAAQGVELRPHDVLLLRTGWLATSYALGVAAFQEAMPEPGLGYSPELVRWCHEAEVVHLVTDTLANEATVDPASGVSLPLHGALLRNLGLGMTEVVWLDDLAAACAADGVWDFLYAAAPLKVVGGSGAPVNPIVLR